VIKQTDSIERANGERCADSNGELQRRANPFSEIRARRNRLVIQ